MLLNYQINNLSKLQSALENHNTITIVGNSNSGRKTVVSHLKIDDAIQIKISPSNNQNYNYGDYLISIKENKLLSQESLEIKLDFSISDILSIGIEKHELFKLEKHLISNIKKAAKKYKLVFIIDNYEKLDYGTKEIIRRTQELNLKNKLKKGLITIYISENNHNIIGKEIYFESLKYENENLLSVFIALNLDPNIKLSDDVMSFILQNSDGNINLISSIINDLNNKKIDKNLNDIDANNTIAYLINNKIASKEFADRLRHILNIMAISEKFFNNLDLSFLLSEEVNIIDIYMHFAESNSYVSVNNNYYQILFGIIKKIFSTISENQKREIYNKIVNLINIFYPNSYEEKYHFANLSKSPKANIFLLQLIFKKIREGKSYFEFQEKLSEKDIELVDKYRIAFSKLKNNLYFSSIKIIDDILSSTNIISPIREELMLIKSQNLIKDIDEKSRNEAVEILSYNTSDESIDPYLRYRLETRKIAAFLHNGHYKDARNQSNKTETMLLKLYRDTQSPGIEYYLNVLYRKYCNTHSYESSISAIEKSIEYFSANSSYYKENYIAINNALALNLINGNHSNAKENIITINELIEKHFNYKFPRSEIYSNNLLIYNLIYKKDSLENICDNFRNLCKQTKGLADNILICSNYAIALALKNDLPKAYSILNKRFNDLSIIEEKEGIYKFRIYCNYAILVYLYKHNKNKALEILNQVKLSQDDLHYSDRKSELDTIIKTMNNNDYCSSASQWMDMFKKNVKIIKNYYCLYQQGFVFTTLFDWDDE